MIDYINLGSTPYDEPCAQVGSNNYYEESIIECRKYKNYLEELFHPEHCRFQIKTFQHDFGSYREVCVVFDDTNELATKEAIHIENNIPQYWSN